LVRAEGPAVDEAAGIFYHQQTGGEALMTTELRQPIDKNAIRAKLVELIRRAAEQGIDIEALIHEALEIADVEPP
jgi:hypothetical protein